MCKAVGIRMFTAVLFMAAKNWEISVFSNKGLVNSAFSKVCSGVLMGMTGKKKKKEIVTFRSSKF